MSKMTANDINIEHDGETGDYFVVWEPKLVVAGKTEREALEELKVTAYYLAETLIELKLKNI